jgi:5-methylcytosine-specific restriction endonuclease McrA
MPRPRIYVLGKTIQANPIAKQNQLQTQPQAQPHRKESIPKALREQVWKRYIGDKYSNKCTVGWCQNTISTFDFHVGHNIPESKGGTLDITNLRPICARCNLSMGSKYTISEWNEIGGRPQGWRRYFCFL